MRTGCINRYNEERGFGWIKVKGQLLLEFFHITNWGGESLPVIGQVVTFEIDVDRKGRLQAVNVTPMLAPVSDTATRTATQTEGRSGGAL